MLDQDSLSQLKQLKTNIIESKDRGEGEVRGSQRRFGFVKLDDGRDVFLAPDEMQRVFPGDRVRINVITDDKGKFKAELEKLIDSPLGIFTGRYVIRGQGHFVEPDLPRFNKLLFIPPSQRKKAKPGDLLQVKVTRHPFRDGKSQVNIIDNIGQPDEAGIEGRYTISKFELPRQWPNDDIPEQDSRAEAREDLRDLPLVTIDSADTRDVDDALWAAPEGDGWQLVIAVADPGAYIAPGSPLDLAARARANTVYLPGCAQPMLPEAITQDRCSLLPDVDRAAIVCRLKVSAEGEISDIQFSEALIRSHAKLSYQQVQQHLDGSDTLDHDALGHLKAAADALKAYRRQHYLIMPEQPDFRYELDDNKRICAIARVDRNDAHRLVEECMLAANRAAAQWLGDSPALYNSHPGLREDRYDSVNKVIASELPALAGTDITSLEGYQALIKAAETTDSTLPLQSIFARMLRPGELSTSPKPHFGLGLERYSTFTSPLRKYSDLLVQRCIRAKLQGEQPALPDDETIAALQEQLRHSRQASRQLEQWLQYQYLAGQDKDAVYQGRIAHMNGGGFTVELNDTGISGFVEARSIPEKLSFDADTLRLFNAEKNYQLEQAVNVKVAEIDPFQRRLIFTLLEPEQAPMETETEKAQGES
ncbi:VacB/RNase II family 3'-5' exoribonuclease [Spongiibacter nanhainus]|uniref:exoribonuclease II n=1 Tax=Spongiibacter nanhainus TaxID=2794344 RepID=A0A7T4R162_9GAMM|nr:VacB/RNase II family 3'-5' exoribonuclease [Spongiibacter nanhainus]QQD18534.1 VacB/RNase II family 3'-5' exoribonuclease [Spongiibacter nanhainus]